MALEAAEKNGDEMLLNLMETFQQSVQYFGAGNRAAIPNWHCQYTFKWWLQHKRKHNRRFTYGFGSINWGCLILSGASSDCFLLSIEISLQLISFYAKTGYAPLSFTNRLIFLHVTPSSIEILAIRCEDLSGNRIRNAQNRNSICDIINKQRAQWIMTHSLPTPKYPSEPPYQQLYSQNLQLESCREHQRDLWWQPGFDAIHL